MNESQKPLFSVSVKFRLYADKQRRLLRILMNCGQLTPTDLSELLNIPREKLISVLEGKDFLTADEAVDLVQYFCTFCTN